MTNIISTDITFGGAWYNTVVAKQEDYQVNITVNPPTAA